MSDMIKMVVVIAVLASLSGGLLAGIRNSTLEKIEYQQLVFVKGPAIRTILNKCSNDPITDRFKIKDGDTERSIFIGVLDGKPQVVAFESAGKGFGGMIGVMVGVNLNDDKLLSIGVTTHAETPGLGSKATESWFGAKFTGLPIMELTRVKNDGGQIDSITGATITTRGVCEAVTIAGDIYKRIKPKIQEKIKSMKL